MYKESYNTQNFCKNMEYELTGNEYVLNNELKKAVDGSLLNLSEKGPEAKFEVGWRKSKKK